MRIRRVGRVVVMMICIARLLAGVMARFIGRLIRVIMIAAIMLMGMMAGMSRDERVISRPVAIVRMVQQHVRKMRHAAGVEHQGRGQQNDE